MVQQLKESIESKANRQFSTFDPVQVATQVVAGTNYFVKIEVGSGEHIHARIFRSLPHAGQPPQVHSVQCGLTASDPLKYF